MFLDENVGVLERPVGVLWERYLGAQKDESFIGNRQLIAQLRCFNSIAQFKKALVDISRDEFLRSYWEILLVTGYIGLTEFVLGRLKECAGFDPIDIDPWPGDAVSI